MTELQKEAFKVLSKIYNNIEKDCKTTYDYHSLSIYADYGEIIVCQGDKLIFEVLLILGKCNLIEEKNGLLCFNKIGKTAAYFVDDINCDDLTEEDKFQKSLINPLVNEIDFFKELSEIVNDNLIELRLSTEKLTDNILTELKNFLNHLRTNYE